MSRPQRKKLFVDANVQGSLARRLILHWLVFLVTASLVSFILQVLANPFRPIGDHFRDLWWTHGPFLLVVVFLLPVFVVDTIKLSHRFAGPIFSLRRAMREIVQGKPARKLKFREGDFWQDLADDYNAMLVRLDAAGDGARAADADSDEQQLVEAAD